MILEDFIDELAEIEFPGVFNPYADVCESYDKPDAPLVRKQNLTNYLRSFECRGAATLWVGRDLGYRGGRRTGLPLTDEIHLDRVNAVLGDISVSKATIGDAMAERTAAEIWKMIHLMQGLPLMWNVFPLHPHSPSQPFSNRAHTSVEGKTMRIFLGRLIEWSSPSTVIAIGKDAFKVLTQLDVPCTYVRHPSYGGQAEFIAGMREVLAIR